MITAAAVGFIGVMGQFFGLLLAQGSGGDSAPAISVVLTGAGATTVVGVMAWVVKKVVSGEMVPLPIRNLIEQMTSIIETQNRLIERKEAELLELRELVRSGTEAQFAMHEHLRAVSRQDPPLPSRSGSYRGFDKDES